MTRKIQHGELRALCETLLETGGVDTEQAREVTRNLVWSEMIGRHNFGLLRLPIYLERVASGGLKCPSAPKLTDLSNAAALLDADGGFGQYGGRLAMEQAISLARDEGIGTVGVKNSNFFGTGAYFTHLAAQAGMIGIAMSNSFPKVTAHNGRLPVFGTNPFAFGAPLRNGESLMVDMATSALAGSTVRECIDRKKPLPEGMAIDSDGLPITDPKKVSDGALLPAAGAKGYGLSLMVEILAGVLTGAGVSDGVASMYKDVGEPGNNGHFMIAIDVCRFMPLAAFHERLDMLASFIKASNGEEEVLLPGEIRWERYRDSLRNGVELETATLRSIETVCRDLKVACPWTSEKTAA